MKSSTSVYKLGKEKEVRLGINLLKVQATVTVGVGQAHQIDGLIARPVRIFGIQKLNNLTPERYAG